MKIKTERSFVSFLFHMEDKDKDPLPPSKKTDTVSIDGVWLEDVYYGKQALEEVQRTLLQQARWQHQLSVLTGMDAMGISVEQPEESSDSEEEDEDDV